MAHQAHVLPWQTLADNFKFVHANARYGRRTNLYPRSKPGQGKQLQHFAKVFARLIDEFSKHERAKYPADSTPPTLDEVFVPDATVNKIAPTVKRYRAPAPTTSHSYARTTSPHLQLEERKIPFWITHVNANLDYPEDETRERLELLKTLLLYGEMEPLLRIARHPDVRLSQIWSFPWDCNTEYGWTDVQDTALMAYLCLNVFLLKPELYHASCREQLLRERKKINTSSASEELDYRLASSFQETLIHCTWTRSNWDNFETCTYPHRDFFGIPWGMYTLAPWNQSPLYGVVQPSHLADESFRGQHIPRKQDVDAVISLLGKKNLPAELALQILEHAQYIAVPCRLSIPDNPLHPENGEELKKYLSYCWKLLVRTDVLLKENGCYINWEHAVTGMIFRLWGVPYPKMCDTNPDYHEHERRDAEEVNRFVDKRFFI